METVNVINNQVIVKATRKELDDLYFQTLYFINTSTKMTLEKRTECLELLEKLHDVQVGILETEDDTINITAYLNIQISHNHGMI